MLQRECLLHVILSDMARPVHGIIRRSGTAAAAAMMRR